MTWMHWVLVACAVVSSAITPLAGAVPALAPAAHAVLAITGSIASVLGLLSPAAITGASSGPVASEAAAVKSSTDALEKQLQTPIVKVGTDGSK